MVRMSMNLAAWLRGKQEGFRTESANEGHMRAPHATGIDRAAEVPLWLATRPVVILHAQNQCRSAPVAEPAAVQPG